MTIIRHVFLLSFSILILLGCNSRNGNKAIELKLAKLEVGSAFSLDTINTNTQWDRFYIVGPYQYDALRKKIDIPDYIKDITLTEGYCVIVFLKGSLMVESLSVARNIIDFSDSNNNGDFNDDHDVILPNTVFVLKDGRKAVFE